MAFKFVVGKDPPCIDLLQEEWRLTQQDKHGAMPAPAKHEERMEKCSVRPLFATKISGKPTIRIVYSLPGKTSAYYQYCCFFVNHSVIGKTEHANAHRNIFPSVNQVKA